MLIIIDVKDNTISLCTTATEANATLTSLDFTITINRHSYNEYVLGEILGLSAAEIKALEEDKVIGKRPAGM